MRLQSTTSKYKNCATACFLIANAATEAHTPTTFEATYHCCCNTRGSWHRVWCGTPCLNVSVTACPAFEGSATWSVNECIWHFWSALNLKGSSQNTSSQRPCPNLHWNKFAVSPPVRFEGGKSCFFLNGRSVTNFGRLALSGALHCGFTFFWRPPARAFRRPWVDRNQKRLP